MGRREEKHNFFLQRITYAAELMGKQCFTNEEIIDKVNKKFTIGLLKSFDKKEIGRTRWMLKQNMIPGIRRTDGCFDRIFLINGKKFTKAERKEHLKQC